MLSGKRSSPSRADTSPSSAVISLYFVGGKLKLKRNIGSVRVSYGTHIPYSSFFTNPVLHYQSPLVKVALGTQTVQTSVDESMSKVPSTVQC